MRSEFNEIILDWQWDRILWCDWLEHIRERLEIVMMMWLVRWYDWLWCDWLEHIKKETWGGDEYLWYQP